jgi:excisionase family DNA binding protein
VTAPNDREDLVLSIRDVAKVLGVSDDLVYELVARGEIPCLRLGRRRLIPRRAVELMIEHSLEAFDPAAPSSRLPTSRVPQRESER